MARVNDNARKGFSVKANGMVYVQMTGQTIMQRLPHRKKDAWTPGMLQNLEKIRLVNCFCALFWEFLILQIWSGMDKKKSF